MAGADDSIEQQTQQILFVGKQLLVAAIVLFQGDCRFHPLFASQNPAFVDLAVLELEEATPGQVEECRRERLWCYRSSFMEQDLDQSRAELRGKLPVVLRDVGEAVGLADPAPV